MAVTDHTLTESAGLRNDVGWQADEATRNLTKAWVGAWDDLVGQWRAATADIAVRQAELGHHPHPWELSRLGSVQQALRATEQQLVVLGQQANTQITDAAGNAVTATVEREPHILASQLPAALAATAVALYASRLTAHTVDALTSRIGQGITALTRPIGRTTHDAVQREIIRGTPTVAARGSAATLAGRIEAAFNSGLTRAVTVARTETVDASRAVSAASNRVNQDVVRGWIWLCVCDLRSCVACWVMHGTEHATTDPGPEGHQQCRCGRLPHLRPWRNLGIGAAEPLSLELDGKTRFDALPEVDQIAILGPTRHELLCTGRVRWADLATRRDNPRWRPAYIPTPVGDLRQLAAQPV